MAFRFLLNADDKLLDLPVYTAAGYNNIEMPQNRIPSKGAVDVPSVTKFSDLTFTVIDQITGTYF